MYNEFIEKLNSIGLELLEHHSSKSSLTTELIQERLNNSLKNYYSELRSTVNRLSSIDAIKLDRNMNETSGYIRRFE